MRIREQRSLVSLREATARIIAAAPCLTSVVLEHPRMLRFGQPKVPLAIRYVHKGAKFGTELSADRAQILQMGDGGFWRLKRKPSDRLPWANGRAL